MVVCGGDTQEVAISTLWTGNYIIMPEKVEMKERIAVLEQVVAETAAEGLPPKNSRNCRNWCWPPTPRLISAR